MECGVCAPSLVQAGWFVFVVTHMALTLEKSPQTRFDSCSCFFLCHLYIRHCPWSMCSQVWNERGIRFLLALAFVPSLR